MSYLPTAPGDLPLAPLRWPATRAALCWAASCLWLLLSPPLCAVARAEPGALPVDILLKVGQQEVIGATDVTSYSEGAGGIADIRLTRDGSQFIIVGERPGSTSLLVLTRTGARRSYRIEVQDDQKVRPRDPNSYGPGTVDARANVRLDVYFVRMGQSRRHQLGVAWPGSIGGGTLGFGANLLDGVVTDATVVADQALPRLDMAQNAGWAKLMHHSALISANGAEATLSGGGEVNLLARGSLGADLRQVRFGSRVTMRPRYDSESGRIELSVDADVSDLTEDRGTGVPGRITSQVKAVVNLELGQALVLAGLRTRSERTGTSGLPGLSRIPIVGALFGSLSGDEEQGESVLVVVPSVIDATSASARERVSAALRAYRDYEGDTPPRLFPAPAPTPASAPASADREPK